MQLILSNKNEFCEDLSFGVKIIKTTVKKVDNYKCLEKIIHSSLNWLEHLKTVKSKLFKMIDVSL